MLLPLCLGVWQHCISNRGGGKKTRGAQSACCSQRSSSSNSLLFLNNGFLLLESRDGLTIKTVMSNLSSLIASLGLSFHFVLRFFVLKSVLPTRSHLKKRGGKKKEKKI